MTSVSETRDVRGFDEIALQGRGDVVLEQSGQESVTIEVDEAILPLIRAEVEGHRLVLGFRNWWDHLLHPLSPVRFRVTAITVRGISIAGSGSFEVGALQSDSLKVGVSGSGEVIIEQVTAQTIDVGIAGAGKIVVSGETERQNIRISGSGNVQNGGLAAKEAEVHISGSGSVTVNPTDRLDVHISGSGSVRYLGQPQISQHISGSGSVAKR